MLQPGILIMPASCSPPTAVISASMTSAPVFRLSRRLSMLTRMRFETLITTRTNRFTCCQPGAIVVYASGIYAHPAHH